MNKDRVEEVMHRLRGWANAYPESMFPRLSENERRDLIKAFPGFLDRISADMGRHVSNQMQEMADVLEKALGE